MNQLLFVTAHPTRFAELPVGIEALGGSISWADSGRQALATIARTRVDLVLADEDLGDMQGLELVKQVVATHPMINCALVSSLSKQAYHEASEGLGILMQLPPEPVRADGERLMAHLNRITGTATVGV